MAYSYNEVGTRSPGDTLEVPFPFLSREHVSVTVDGELTDKWSWLSSGLLRINTGFPSGEVTRVFRKTPIESLQGTLQGASVFDWDGMNANFLMNLYALQEYADGEDVRDQQVDIALQSLAGALDSISQSVQAAATSAQNSQQDRVRAEEAASKAVSDAQTAIQNTLNLINQKVQAAASSAQSAATSAQAAATFDPANYYNRSQVEGLIVAGGVPIGASIFWNRSLSIPTGFMKENGGAISRTAYPELFAVIGTTFGAGDGSTTFNLPESRGEFIRGLDDGRGVDAGRTLGASQADQNASHTHTGTATSAGAHSHTFTMFSAVGGSGLSGVEGAYRNTTGTTSLAGAHTHPLAIDSQGGAEARPRNTAKLVLIRAF